MSLKRDNGGAPEALPWDGSVEGQITIVQEDRFRLMDERGRGYLFTAREPAESLPKLERWRDERRRVTVRFSGVPDIGALAHRVEPL